MHSTKIVGVTVLLRTIRFLVFTPLLDKSNALDNEVATLAAY